MFERVIYTTLWILILGIIGVGGWFAYSRLNHDFIYESDRFADAGEISPDEDAIGLNFDDNAEPAPSPDAEQEPSDTPSEPVEEETSAPSAPTNDEYAELVEDLEQLIEDEIFMKVGSRGTRVGTVQEFLNIFRGTDTRVDNDFGNGTKAAVIEFQEDAGITADGEPGPQTYQEMIDWLNAQ